MTDNAFATCLVFAAIPTGMASAIGGVWLYRTLVAALIAN
jgi:hypothetical protein